MVINRKLKGSNDYFKIRDPIVYKHENNTNIPIFFLSIVLVLLIIIIPILIWFSPESRLLVSDRDYDNVEKIYINDEFIVNESNQEEFFNILKNAKTQKAGFSLVITESMEYMQHKIKVDYADGNSEVIYLYCYPFENDGICYAIRTMYMMEGNEYAVSYEGYERILEYIENSLE